MGIFQIFLYLRNDRKVFCYYSSTKKLVIYFLVRYLKFSVRSSHIIWVQFFSGLLYFWKVVLKSETFCRMEKLDLNIKKLFYRVSAYFIWYSFIEN